MEPLLSGIADRKVCSMNSLEAIVAKRMFLSDEDLNKRTKSGRMTQVRHRLTWTKYYLKKAGLVESPAHGQTRITEDSP